MAIIRIGLVNMPPILPEKAKPSKAIFSHIKDLFGFKNAAIKGHLLEEHVVECTECPMVMGTYLKAILKPFRLSLYLICCNHHP